MRPVRLLFRHTSIEEIWYGTRESNSAYPPCESGVVTRRACPVCPRYGDRDSHPNLTASKAGVLLLDHLRVVVRSPGIAPGRPAYQTGMGN